MTAPSARSRLPLVWMLAALALFFVANRAAYKGYFSDDDLDNLTWPTYVDSSIFYNGLLTPRFDESNFRPVGDLYYRYLYRGFKLNYRPYVAVLQLFHVLNAALLYLLLRRLGLGAAASGAGALFYGFHAAVLEAYWKPMYIFDVLCGTLCLLALLLYIRGRWIAALVPFWLAYKSKEIAILLPVALLAYELWLGARKWTRLIPYFLIALSFGLQALWWNRSVSPVNTYVLRFTPQSLWHSLAFYSSAILFLPYAGLALLALPVWVRDRRLYLGLILAAATLFPLLALPRRMDTVYWYVPMLGVSIAIAAAAARTPRFILALLAIVWLPWNYMILREKRREILSIADENRWYTTGLLNYARGVPPVKAVLYQSTPLHMRQWGVEGAIRHAFGFQVDAAWYQGPRAGQALANVPMAVVGYYPVQRSVKGLLRTRNELLNYIHFTDEIPAFQFGPGWYNRGDPQLWIAPQAEVTLRRPQESNEFEIVALLPPAALERDGPAKVTVLEDGKPLGVQTLAERRRVLRWKLSGGASGDKKITIQTEPLRHMPGLPGDLGIMVEAIGFVGP